MNVITTEHFNTLLKNALIKPRLKNDLRFTTSIEYMRPEDWAETEMLAIRDKSGKNGVLIIEIDSGLYLLPFETKRISKSSTTGREQPIICDFCKTWQSGSRAASITFLNAKNTSSNVTYLCCKDLLCSNHVRSKTPAAKVSRAQLRESIDDEQRTKRLRDNLERLMTYLEFNPIRR